MAIYELTADRIVEIPDVRFADHNIRERADLQRLLRDQIEVISADLLVVAEEFGDWSDSRRRIDLLAIDRNANLVVIELKRDEAAGHVELQAIRYAAMVSTMTFDQLEQAFDAYLTTRGDERDARQELLDFLGWDEPDEESFAQDVRMFLIAAEFSKEVTTSVLWLNQRDLDVTCVRLRPQSDGVRLFLEVQQIVPLPEASEYFVGVREKTQQVRAARRAEVTWEGDYYVNVGMDDPGSSPVMPDGRGDVRHWDWCRKLGHLAAGGGRRYSAALRRLVPGDSVYAYQKGAGYVGRGVVAARAVPFQEARASDGSRLAERLVAPSHDQSDDPEDWEYVLRVDWQETVDLSQAFRLRGAFANQNVVCKLRDPLTLERLRDEFGRGEA